MGKPFIEINHTTVVLNRIKKDITRLANIIRIVSMIGFSAWYVYLIWTNWSSIPHLIAYIVLFALVISTFFIEQALKPQKSDSRINKRIKTERKRGINIFSKTLKYSAKAVTIALALYASITNPTSNLDLIWDIASGGMWVISVLFEVAMGFIDTYVDQLKLSFELDYNNSRAVDIVNSISKISGDKGSALTALEKKLQTIKPEDRYTEQEKKIIKSLVADADILREQKEKELDAKLTAIKADIKQAKKSVAASKAQNKRKLTKAEKKDVTQKFEEKKTQASQIISLPEKLDELFDKGQMLFDNLPVEIPALKNIPLFLSLINNYASGRYKDISATSIIAVVAAVLYFIAPIDVIPETIPGVGYLDDAFVVDMVLKVVKKELKKFEQWKNSAHPTDNLPTKK